MVLLNRRGPPQDGGIGQGHVFAPVRTPAGILLGGDDTVAANSRPLPRLLQPRQPAWADAESLQEKNSMDQLHFLECLL